jgi:hypothetical protein
MVFVHDQGSVFDAPLEKVWAFVSSREVHSAAHRHRSVRREIISETKGQYSWEQEFDGTPARFTMRWTSFHPVGVAYDVLEGPFAGSRFFLYYTPRGPRTEVGVVGEFVSSTIPEKELPAAVDRFFSLEFEQDSRALSEAKVAAPPSKLWSADPGGPSPRKKGTVTVR